MITKETILGQLSTTSDEINWEFNKLYSVEIEEIAEEIAMLYQFLKDIIDNENQAVISDSDFQAALLLWTALNTYLSAVELFKRGYQKEPLMLTRNILEVASAAYDIHLHPAKLKILREKPMDFDSKQSIKIAKKINPMLAKMWGMLSSHYSHVSMMHSAPHLSTRLCIGGLFEPENQKVSTCGLLPPMNMTLDLLGSILELTFIEHIKSPRFWIMKPDGTYTPTMPKKNQERGRRIRRAMERALSKKPEQA